MKLENRFKGFHHLMAWKVMIMIQLVAINILLALFSSSYGYERNDLVYSFEFLNFKRGDGEKTYLVVFAQIPTENLIFVKFADGFYASYDITVALQNQSGVEIARESFVDSIVVKSYKETEKFRPPRLVRFVFKIESGEYVARVQIKDLETRKHVGFKKNLQIPNYAVPGLQISDLQIAASISPSNEKNALVKNKREIVPNVSRILGPKSNLLQVYWELYNLYFSPEKPNSKFVVTYSIANSKGKEVKKLQYKYTKPVHSSAVTVGIPIGELEEGLYKLKLKVEDSDNSHSVWNSTSFYKLKTSKPNESS